MRMIIAFVIILWSFPVLSAEPVIDATDSKTYNESLADMMISLSPDKQSRLKQAVRLLPKKIMNDEGGQLTSAEAFYKALHGKTAAQILEETFGKEP